MKLLLTYFAVIAVFVTLEILTASSLLNERTDYEARIERSPISPDEYADHNRNNSGSEHDLTRRFLIGSIVKIAGPLIIKAAASLAGKIVSGRNSPTALLEATQEANRKLDEINAKLGQLSNQLHSFESTMQHQLQLNRLTTLFGPYVERLTFLTKDIGLQNRNEASQIAWADAILSLRNDGIAQSLSSIHHLVTGTSLFNTKSIVNVFIDGLPISDEKFWEKVDAFAELLMELQTSGYWAWLIAVGIKGSNAEIVRVKDLATQMLGEQENVVFGPLKSPSLRTWPADKYGLIRVRNSGCPVGSWLTGQRRHDTEDDHSANRWSNPLHMDGSWGSNNMAWNFCLKNSSGSGPQWPNGKYCTFAYHGSHNGCPPDMGKGFIKWDDEDHHNKNSVSGTLPDGVYNHNTIIYFCCKTTGNPASEIHLPIQKPFYLFPLEGQGCQRVYKMSVQEEYFHWDCEDHHNEDSRGMPHPKDDGGRNVELHMCYYQRVNNF